MTVASRLHQFQARLPKAHESLAYCPAGTYGQTKMLCDTLIEHYKRYSGLQCALLRPCSVYGPGGPRPKFLYNFLHKAKENKKIVTHRYVNGLPHLDLLFIDDLAAAVVEVLDRGVNESMNLGTGRCTSTRAIAEWFVARLGSTSNVESVPIETSTCNVRMNYSRAHEILGWAPKVELFQGLGAFLLEALGKLP